MTPTPSTPPTTRPPSFDARVMAYAPGLRQLARRLVSGQEQQEELVTDTIITALHRWRSFREDGGMWNWLALTMRSNARVVRAKAARERTVCVDTDDTVLEFRGIAPTQEHEADLNLVVSHLSGRNGTALLRVAMGEQLHEVGADLGVSRQRVLQIVEKARADLRKAVG